jgi:hypothetical protein
MSSYTKSNAQQGRGTQLSIGSSPTAVLELKTIKLSGNKWDTEDTTNLNSSVKEFLATIQDAGEWDISGNRVSGDAGQEAIETAFASGALTAFTIQLPPLSGVQSTGDSYAFNAIVVERDFSIDVLKAVDFTCKLKVSGVVTMTAGTALGS